SDILQTITVNIDGANHHVVSYYREEDVSINRLRRPTANTEIMSLEVPISAVKDTRFRHPPRVDLDDNNIPRMCVTPLSTL
ncbi:uncharacterized protein STEHIDRAFT_49664, partial [Stereum hirsutum FP-91666 SS1]|uniref:uncharacterized protein n=1 Tax=Stereum hirsutum (strain FP-91666) TaxID=721885 RepID=UPI00044105D0